MADLGPGPTPALLTIGTAAPADIATLAALTMAMADFDGLETGTIARLARSERHWIKAIRRNSGWSDTVRRGSWLSLASFTAEGTTGYTARQVQADRAASSLRQRLKLAVTAPPPEHALGTAQVRTLFEEYLLGRRFSLPQSGA